MEKVEKKLKKEMLDLPIGSKEQAIAFKQWQEVSKMIQSKEQAEFDRRFKEKTLDVETALKRENKDIETKLKEKEFDHQYTLKEKEFDHQYVIETMHRDENKEQLEMDNKKSKREVLKTVFGIGGTIAATAFTMSCYNATLNKCFAFEKDGIISSTGTKMALNLFKPKL